MKKYLLMSLLMMTAHVQTMMAEATDVSTLDNVVYSMPLTAAQGRQADLSFALKNSSAVRGFELSLYLPEGVTISEEVTEDGNGNTQTDYLYSFNKDRLPRNDDHGISFSKHTDTSGALYYKLLCSSLNDKLFTGSDGELFTLSVEVAETVEPGEYPVYIKGLLVGDYNGVQLNTAADLEGTLTIVDASQMRTILDEASTEMPEAAEGVNVTVKRTIKANQWNTICLPFAISAEQMTSAFGEGVTVVLNDFKGYVAEEDEEENIVSIKVNFQAATEMQANHPYIIKVDKDVTEINVDNVNIDPEEEPTVAAVKRKRTQWSEMIGTYVNGFEVPEQTLFLSGGKFYYSTGKTKMKAFRAYFDFYDLLASVENAESKIAFDFDTTDIKDIKDARLKMKDSSVYNLNGQRVISSPSGRPGGVPTKGVYIINGKKCVVK